MTAMRTNRMATLQRIDRQKWAGVRHRQALEKFPPVLAKSQSRIFGAPDNTHQRALEAALEHGYPADRIREIQTLLEQKASS